MKMKAIHVLATVAFAATAFAQQQTPPATAPNPAVAPNAKQTEPAKPTAPPEDPTSTTSTTPAPPAQNSQDKSVTPDKQAQQGQQQSQQPTPQQNDQQSKLPQSDASSPVAPLDTGGMTSAELQARIEAALHNEPTLSGDALTVNVTDDEINVTGTVGSGKERTTASRIVQSFGENRKVKEKINVSGVKK
jgi:outer membrane biosynthesis protein TonB